MKIGLGQDIGVGGIVRAWTQVSALLVVVAAGRFLNSEEFGIFAIATVFVTVTTTILYSGIYEYIIQIDDPGPVADTCFWINLGIAICGAAIMVVGAPVLSNATRAPQLQGVMVLLAPSMLIAALTSWQEALVLRDKRVSGYYAVWFFAETCSAAVAIGMLFHGFKIGALIGYRYSQALLTGLGYTAYTMRLPCFAFQARKAWIALTFASRIYGSRLIGIFSNYSADIIIGVLASPSAAGNYRLASRMVFGVGEIWFQPAKVIAWVRFSSALRDRAGLDREWLVLLTVLSLVAWPALGGLAVLSTQVTQTVLGDTWLAAAPIVAILAFAKSTELFEVFLDPLLVLSGRSQWLLRIRACACIVAIGGFTAAARYGAVHVAWIQAATYLLLAIVTVGLGFKLTKLTLTTLTMALWPGLLTTAVTVGAAAVAAHVTGQQAMTLVANLACDVGAGVLAWAFMVGVVFRRRMFALAGTLKQSGAEPSAAEPAI